MRIPLIEHQGDLQTSPDGESVKAYSALGRVGTRSGPPSARKEAPARMPDSLVSLHLGMSERTYPVRQKAKAIWKKPLFRHYTDHGIEHAERVIAILGRLAWLLKEPLNEDEVYVLLCGAYLHDVGLQHEKFFESDRARDRFAEDEIQEAAQNPTTLEAMIREWHHWTGAEWIRDTRGLGCIEQRLADEVAVVVEGHRKESVHNIEDRSKFAQPMRLRLLAALLRLADELDLDCRRVNLDEFEWADIPDGSKAHWWKCHYVYSVDIAHDGRIEITFQLPETGREHVAHVVPPLVVDGLRHKLAKEEVLDTLWEYVALELQRTPRILETPGADKRPVPPEVLSTLRQQLLDLRTRIARDAVEPMAAVSPGMLTIEWGGTPQRLIQKAVDLSGQGKRRDAVAVLQRAVSLYPTFAALRALLANELVSLNRWKAGEAAAQKAVDSDPTNVLGRLTLGVALGMRAEHAQALKHLWFTDVASHSVALPAVYRKRLHLAIARSLAGLGDYWYALDRIHAASELAADNDTQPADELESQLASLRAEIEAKLAAFEYVMEEQVIEDPALRPILGEWTTEPLVVYEEHEIPELPEGVVLGGSSRWLDYVFECEFQLLNRAAGFFIRADAWSMTGIMMQFSASKLRRHQRVHSNYFARDVGEVELPRRLGRDQWHVVRFEVRGDTMKTYLDDALIDDWSDFLPQYESGKIGLRLHGREFALYRSPRVTVLRRAASDDDHAMRQSASH